MGLGTLPSSASAVRRVSGALIKLLAFLWYQLVVDFEIDQCRMSTAGIWSHINTTLLVQTGRRAVITERESKRKWNTTGVSCVEIQTLFETESMGRPTFHLAERYPPPSEYFHHKPLFVHR